MALIAVGSLLWTGVKFLQSGARGFGFVGKLFAHPRVTVSEMMKPDPGVKRKDLQEFEARLKQDGTISQAQAEQIARQIATHAAREALQELLGRDQGVKSLTAAIQALPRAVRATTKPGQPSVPTVEEVVRLLAAGQTKEAEAAFSYVLEVKSREGADANKEAAAAARHLGALSFFGDSKKALDAYGRATKLDPDNIEAWDRLGALQVRTGVLDAAQQSFGTVLVLGTKIQDQWWAAKANIDLGMISYARDDMPKAHELVSCGLKLFKELGNKQGTAVAYGNLGLIAQSRDELPEAEELITRGLNLFKELDDKQGIAMAYLILAGICSSGQSLDIAKFTKAMELAQEAMKVFETARDRWGVAHVYSNMGGMHAKLALYAESAMRRDTTKIAQVLPLFRESLDKGENCQLQAIQIFQEIDDRQGMAKTHGILGEIYYMASERDKACAQWGEACVLYTGMSMPVMVDLMKSRMRAAGCPNEADGTKQSVSMA